MTETLQQKIDNYPNPHVIYKKDLNKALQEFREQIKLKQRLQTHPAQLFGYQMALNDVLALIGEKSN